ncbi:MAG: glutamate dehydrogenase, partial [Bacteroidota bacterium]
LLAEAGATVVGVSDHTGGYHNGDGLDIEAVADYVLNVSPNRTLAGYPGAEAVAGEDFMGVDCDVMIPAAIESAIHSDNVDTVKARLVVEGANLPVTPKADRVLAERGVLVVPDILANAGGVIVSYFEWSQNFQQYRWSVEEVNQRLERILMDAYDDVVERRKSLDSTMREAAFALGIERIVKAEKLRGAL